jgi:hypothetical protein
LFDTVYHSLVHWLCDVLGGNRASRTLDNSRCGWHLALSKNKRLRLFCCFILSLKPFFH